MTAEIEAIVARRVADALTEAAAAIERRRCARRMRWLRKRRWSGRDEACWSQGVWDAGLIVSRAARAADAQAARTRPGLSTSGGAS